MKSGRIVRAVKRAIERDLRDEEAGRFVGEPLDIGVCGARWHWDVTRWIPDMLEMHRHMTSDWRVSRGIAHAENGMNVYPRPVAA